MDGLRLWNARAIDPASRRVIERATLLLRDGRIAELGEARGDAPAGVVDLGGRTVLPGLIDAHVHLIPGDSRAVGFGPPPELHGEDPRPRELVWFLHVRACAAFLAAGITSVRDVGAYDDEAIVVRRAVELGLVTGPRILTCGRIISATAPGGRLFGTMYAEADGPWAVRRAVREQLRRGADFVKLMATGARSVEREDPEPAQLTTAEVEAIVDEAHRLGLRVAAHCEGLAGTRIAVEQGVDTIEHGFALQREPVLLEAMAARGQVLVPTLTTFHDLAERFAPAWVPRLVDQAKRQLEEAYLNIGAARAAGVTIAMGFDSGPPGADSWELVRLGEAGLGAMEALAAATAGSAAALGDTGLGRLEPGAVADLLVVDGDPLADLRLLLRPRRIGLVFRDGRAVAGRDLEGPRVPPEREPAGVAPVPSGPPSPCGAALAGTPAAGG
jgi:imidazolonepropionase-like amidohydrolase